MIKGWKVDPHWCFYYTSRAARQQDAKDSIQMLAQQKEMADGQSEFIEIQKEHIKKQREHMEQCHADKLEAGEITQRPKAN